MKWAGWGGIWLQRVRSGKEDGQIKSYKTMCYNNCYNSDVGCHGGREL